MSTKNGLHKSTIKQQHNDRMSTQAPIAFANDRLIALSMGKDFKVPELHNAFLKTSSSTQYRDVLHLPLNQGEAWIFNYGVIVFWGTQENERLKVLEKASAHIENAAIKNEIENFRFALNKQENHIRKDTIQLQGNEPLRRLAASHALAQSIKLNTFEEQAQKTIQMTAHIPRSLAKTGSTTLSRKQTAKMRGELFSTKSDIILNYDLLDTPDFFWEHPEYQSIYEPVARYLEIRPRLALLSRKLETIHELFEMLADEQKHKNSSRLEWIIIILIAFEIIYVALHG